MSCKGTTNTPINQGEDPCNGKHASTACITESMALPEIGIEENSTQQEINIALQTAMYTLLNKPFKLNRYVVNSLPLAPEQGTMAFVTDALAPTYLNPVVAGGTETCPVFFNGLVWVCH